MLTEYPMTADTPRHALVLQCLPDKFRELKSWMELAAYAKLSPSPSEQLGAGIQDRLDPLGEEAYLNPVPNVFR